MAPDDAHKCPACGLLNPRSAERCDCGFDFAANQRIVTSEAWFTVGEAKFVFMFVATFGLYQIHWFYRQWDHVRDTTREKINPATRAIFAVFFCHSLFKRIIASAPETGRTMRVRAGFITTAYVLLSLAFRLPSVLSLIGFLHLLPLLYVVRLANASAVQHDPGVDRNRRLTLGNWAWVGVAVLLFGAIGVSAHREEMSSAHHLANIAADVNLRLPKVLDSDTELVRTDGHRGLFIYRYRLTNHVAADIDPNRFRDIMRTQLLEGSCRAGKLLLQSGVTLRHVYMDRNGTDVVSIDIMPSDCGPH